MLQGAAMLPSGDTPDTTPPPHQAPLHVMCVGRRLAEKALVLVLTASFRVLGASPPSPYPHSLQWVTTMRQGNGR